MRILSEPVDGLGVYGEITYTIGEADPGQCIEIEIWVNGTVAGRKRMCGLSQYDVNIAPYLRPFIDVQPQNANNRSVESSITVDGTATSTRTFTAGILPHKDPPSDMSRPQEARERPEGVELQWLNPYGALDSYIFTPNTGQEVAVSKSRARTTQGREVYDTRAEHLSTLCSDHEDVETLLWLSQILASPRVWVHENDGSFRRIDIVTDRAIFRKDRPSRLEIVIRNAQ